MSAELARQEEQRKEDIARRYGLWIENLRATGLLETEEIEGIKDEEFDGRHWQTWVDVNKLSEINIKPKTLTEKILASYKNGFSNDTEYVGVIE